MNYKEALEFLESFPNLDQPRLGDKSGVRVMTPAKMRAILSSMQNPQLGRSTVHITGTKGKGSTAAFIASALNELDGSASLFLCPHLTSYTERIYINSQRIKEETFARGIEELKDLILKEHKDNDPVAQFHILIALFFYLTKNSNPKTRWQVLEVGLGGKGDPTSVFDKKELAVFTPIHLEHTEFLGDTVEDIIENKSGIITEGSTVVVARQNSKDVVETLKKKALDMNAQFVSVEDNYRLLSTNIENEQQVSTVEGPFGKERFTTSMMGIHQGINIMTALATLDQTGVKRDRDSINKGFSKMKLPGRFEVFSRKPVFIADGAHTPESASLLWSSIMNSFKFKKAIVIISVGKDKQIEKLSYNLLKNASYAIVTQSNAKNALDTESLKEIVCRVVNIESTSFPSIEESANKALSLAEPEDLILVTGSLYASAEAKDLYERRIIKSGT